MTDRVASNWLDRAIAYLSPRRGAARLQARALIAALGYEGARTDRRTSGWITAGNSADAEAVSVLPRLRERARDLERNNPHGAKGVEVIVSNKIGTGIMVKPAGPNKLKNKRIDDRWQRWCDEADLTGRLDLFGLQALAERTRCVSGEVLLRFMPKSVASLADTPLRLQVLEPDHLDTARSDLAANGNEIRYGVEYQGFRPVAYWLFDHHPGDLTPSQIRSTYQSKRVPAEDVLHLFKPLRAGQTRGVTDFAPVILRLRALDDYDDAEVLRKKIAACLAAFVRTPSALDGASIGPVAADSAGKKIETFNPGMVAYLRPGEDVTLADPKPSIDYQPFEKVQLHAIAAGLGIPYELMTGDLVEVNYSSARVGLVQFRRAVEADQYQILVPQLCRPIWRRFLQEAAKMDSSIDPETPATYTAPPVSLLDPGKEVPAMIDAISGGVATWPETMREQGYDPAEKLDEIERWQKELKARGIVLSSDATNQIKAPAAAPESPQPSGTSPGARDAAAA